MLGVRPIMPWVYAPTFHMPMSSPKMTRMFGFFAVAAGVCPNADVPNAARRMTARQPVKRDGLSLRLSRQSGVDLVFMSLNARAESFEWRRVNEAVRRRKGIARTAIR